MILDIMKRKQKKTNHLSY